MGYPIGLAPTAEDNGTQPEDMQRWIWSLYRAEVPSIARGLTVSGRSDMRYSISPGVVIFPTGAQQAIAVPFDAVDVSTPAAPSSGSRTDYIYATQAGAIMVGTVQPAGTSLIDKRTVPANVTTTTATTSLLGNRRYAPLFGATMGRIAAWESAQGDLAPVPSARMLCCSLTFTLESDRRLSFGLQQSYDLNRGANGGGDDDWKVASFVWEYWMDGVHRLSVELGVQDFAETKSHTWEVNTLAGTRTVEVYRRQRLTGKPGDTVVHRKGGSNMWPGTSFRINDLGGIE